MPFTLTLLFNVLEMVSCKLSGAFSKAVTKFNCCELTVSACENKPVARMKSIAVKKAVLNFKSYLLIGEVNSHREHSLTILDII